MLKVLNQKDINQHFKTLKKFKLTSNSLRTISPFYIIYRKFYLKTHEKNYKKISSTFVCKLFFGHLYTQCYYNVCNNAQETTIHGFKYFTSTVPGIHADRSASVMLRYHSCYKNTTCRHFDPFKKKNYFLLIELDMFGSNLLLTVSLKIKCLNNCMQIFRVIRINKQQMLAKF